MYFINRIGHYKQNIYYTLNLTIFFQEPQNPTPTITISASDDQPLSDKSEVTVKMEGLVMIKENGNVDVSLALGALLAIYHLYNLEYPAQLRKTFSFIEAFILKVDNVKLPIAVQRVANELKL